MRVVLGLDPGLSYTGYGVVRQEESRILHVAHGVIQTNVKDRTEKRLCHIFRDCQKIIDTYTPSTAGIEALYFARNALSAMPVAQALGVLLLALEISQIPVNAYSPLKVKKGIVGIGQSDKNQMQMMVKMLLGLKTEPNSPHAADALGVAICHCNMSPLHNKIGDMTRA